MSADDAASDTSAVGAASDDLSPAAREALARLIRDDALGQLWRREGEMARLGSEGDALKLDWVAAHSAEGDTTALRLARRGMVDPG